MRSLKKLHQGKEGGKPIIIFDATALSYSAFYTTSSLSYRGKSTGVIFGFLKQVIKIASKFQTDNLIFCWDSQMTWRHYNYPDYKISRRNKYQEMEPEDQEDFDEFLSQRNMIHKKILPQIGLKNSFRVKNYEGDDLIGFLILTRLLKNKSKKIIVSDDNDMYQLLNFADMHLIRKNKLFTKKDFFEKYGINPDQWILAKAIGGCRGDDIKGIPGIGDPKSPCSNALKYIKGELPDGKTLDKIESLKGAKIVAENLPLVTVPYLGELMPRLLIRRNSVTRDKLLKLFDSLGFISFLEKENFAKWKEIFKL